VDDSEGHGAWPLSEGRKSPVGRHNLGMRRGRQPGWVATRPPVVRQGYLHIRGTQVASERIKRPRVSGRCVYHVPLAGAGLHVVGKGVTEKARTLQSGCGNQEIRVTSFPPSSQSPCIYRFSTCQHALACVQVTLHSLSTHKPWGCEAPKPRAHRAQELGYKTHCQLNKSEKPREVADGENS
jgi:hypothetical protein